MEHLDLTTLADRAGLPLEAVRRYRDAYVLFIPAIRVGRTIGFPVEAIEVVRLIADREAAGDDPWTLQAALEAAYPVTVLSAQPVAPGELASPQTPILELLRGVDARYAALAAQVAGLTETVAETVASLSETVTETVAAARPADELAELRAMVAAAHAAIEAAATAAQIASAGQQTAQTAIVDALAEQALHRTIDQAALLRALDDLGGAAAAGQERAVAAHQSLTTAQASLAASTHAEHQALLTASASMAASTHAEHQALLTALDRQKGELAAIRGEQTRLRSELATIQHVVPNLATNEHIEWLGAGLTQLGVRLTAQLGEHLPTGSERDQMTAHIANQTSEGVGKLLDKREAALMGHIDAQLSALARHVESRVAQLDRRVSAIASMPNDAGSSQAALLERITALTRQVTDEAMIQNATLERIASERDEATRLIGQLVAEALATIQQEIRAGTATAMAAQSTTQAAQVAVPSGGTPPAATQRPQPPTPIGAGGVPADPAQRPSQVQTWTDHLVAINGIAGGTSAAGDEAPGNGASGSRGDLRHGAGSWSTPPTTTPTGDRDVAGATTEGPPPVGSSPSPRSSRSTPASTRPPVLASGGTPAGTPAQRPAGGAAPQTTPTGATHPTATPPASNQPTPADGTGQPGLPSRRRLGHPTKPGDLTQVG